MKIITKVLVGSRLHGLNKPDSDYDWRGVHMHDLKDVLSPFKTLKNTTWIEGDEDNTSYELADFCKMATVGNATILEVFFSNQVKETTWIAEEMRNNWEKFIDTDKFVMASRGYAANQYNKMQLFEDVGVRDNRRTAKFAIAYIRVLWQCAEFLKTGEFPCQIDEPKLKEFLLEIKYDFNNSHIPYLTQLFMEMQGRVTEAQMKPHKTFKPDIPWIEDFIHEAYTTE